MRIYLLIIISFLWSLTYGQPKTNPEIDHVQHAIHTVFEALSENNLKKLEDAVVPDVLILEKGEVWNLDTLRGFFKNPRPADFKRTNSFEFFKTEISGNLAIVCYYNNAVIHANANDTHFKWLESGVLRKEGNTWKLKMLHVTRLNP
jgi:ketosteroid isomerase-like protein